MKWPISSAYLISSPQPPLPPPTPLHTQDQIVTKGGTYKQYTPTQYAGCIMSTYNICYTDTQEKKSIPSRNTMLEHHFNNDSISNTLNQCWINVESMLKPCFVFAVDNAILLQTKSYLELCVFTKTLQS